MAIEWINLIAGIILLVGISDSIPIIGKYMHKIGKWIGCFQTFFGILAIVFGILHLGLQGIVAIGAGLILAAGILPDVPYVGKELEKFAKQLRGFQITIGFLAFFVGILGLVKII